jgi:hypothetical protein
VLKEINEHFDKELGSLAANEQRWSEKQEITQGILRLIKDEDEKLIESSQ